ncbi:MAG: hypothetical protein ABJA74_02385 [Lapillicoccus sp.]
MVRPAVEVKDAEEAELDDVAGAVAAGVVEPPEHAAIVTVAAAATAAVPNHLVGPFDACRAPDRRRRILPISLCLPGVTDVAIVRKARSATMCGCPTG